VTDQNVLAVVNELANDCLGADWFDVRDRLEKWFEDSPARAREFIHYAKLLLEEWDRE
jgi:hypothetical protein